MNILSIENLEKTLKDEPLFENVTLGLEEGEKAGIVGKNGAGKSTFLKAIAGIITPDEGKVSIKNGTNIVFLEQLQHFDENTSVKDFLYLEKNNQKIRLLDDYYKALEMSDDKLRDRLFSEIERENLWDLERAYFAAISDMGETLEEDRLMSTLSGGQLKKAAIARSLALKPDLLLLDEPTNHLDIKAIEYLEDYIRKTRASIIIVTHDRHILDAVCTTIWEIDRKHFYRHPGSFSDYLERKEERIVMDEKEQKRLKTILRRELVWLQRGPQARTGKDKNRKDRIEAMQSELRKVRDDKQKEFSSLERRLGKKILEVESISKSYGEKKLFHDFSISFIKGMKIGLIGDNGCGKSTLLDILYGRTEPDSGTVDRGVNTHFGYYDQLGRELQSNKTVLEYALDIGERVVLQEGEEISTARFLELFGFPQSMHRTPIALLSGGERRRLYLITRLITNPNFLLLDEPTNDLDIETMENLEEYISSFPGCAVISSHDRTFLDITVDMLLVIENGNITLFPGSYSAYKEAKDKAETAEKEIKTEAKEVQRPKREKKGLTYKEEKERDALIEEIDKLEALIKELEESFATPDTTPLGNLKERSELYEESKKALDEKSERWLELEEKAQD